MRPLSLYPDDDADLDLDLDPPLTLILALSAHHVHLGGPRITTDLMLTASCIITAPVEVEAEEVVLIR